MCQTRKSDRQEWQSLVVLNGTKIFLKRTNISFLKFIFGILKRGVANSFWNHVIQISSRQMYFQNTYSNLWIVKAKVFIGNIYSLKSNTYFWGTVMFVQDGFLYLIVTKHKLTVWGVSSGGSSLFSLPDPWSRGQKGTGSRISITDEKSRTYNMQLSTWVWDSCRSGSWSQKPPPPPGCWAGGSTGSQEGTRQLKAQIILSIFYDRNLLKQPCLKCFLAEVTCNISLFENGAHKEAKFCNSSVFLY